MSQTLYFATTNQRKMREARQACEPAGIQVEQVILDITEIQSNDPLTVARHKAETAFALTQKPSSSAIPPGTFPASTVSLAPI